MSAGLVIGKFWPPHQGHLGLIDFAWRHVDSLFIIVCSTPTAEPSGQKRARWLQQIYPRAEVILTDDFCAWHAPAKCPPMCSQLWAQRTKALIATPIDAFFASEDYGPSFAEAITATFIEFDMSRDQSPVSGTSVRRNLDESWQQLHKVVRAGLCRKITVMGSESTGTTTLANDLATALGVPCVPEIGRTVSWELMAEAGSMEQVEWRAEHFWRILSEHSEAEEAARHQVADKMLGKSGAVFVADTDALATVAWWERYLGDVPDAVVQFSKTRLADMYLITSSTNVGFHQDGLRDGEGLRDSMHQRFVALAEESSKPFLVVEGSRDLRLQTAIEFIAETMMSNPIFQP